MARACSRPARGATPATAWRRPPRHLLQPRKVAKAVLEDLGVRDHRRSARRVRSRQLGSRDWSACHAAHLIGTDDDDEAEQHGRSLSAPRRRVHEERRANEAAHDPIRRLDRVLRVVELDDPRHRPVGPGELQALAVQPDEEDFAADGPGDVPREWRADRCCVLRGWRRGPPSPRRDPSCAGRCAG